MSFKECQLIQWKAKIINTDLFASCDLCVCHQVESGTDLTWSEMLRTMVLLKVRPLSVITSLGEQALVCLRLSPPTPDRKKDSTYFPNNFSTDQSNLAKLFQVCYAGGYYDHTENGNIKTSHLPSVLMNCILPLLSPTAHQQLGLSIQP
jgi:hypothetical protein